MLQAIRSGDIEEVRSLLSTGGNNINKFVSTDNVYESLTPLGLACDLDKLEIVQELLGRKNIDVDLGRTYSKGNTERKSSPLYLACDSGNLSVVKELLKHGGININNANVTPLCVAVDNRNLRIVEEISKLMKKSGIEIDVDLKRRVDSLLEKDSSGSFGILLFVVLVVVVVVVSMLLFDPFRLISEPRTGDL